MDDSAVEQTRFDKLKQADHAHEADEDEARWDEKLKRITKVKAMKPQSPKLLWWTKPKAWRSLPTTASMQNSAATMPRPSLTKCLLID